MDQVDGAAAAEAEDDAAAGLPVAVAEPGDALALRIRTELDAAIGYAAASRALSTRRAYATNGRAFTAWCDARSKLPLPVDPHLVAVFLASEAARGCAPMTIGRRLAAIGYAHRQHGMQPPQLREGAAAIGRDPAQPRQAIGAQAGSRRRRAARDDRLRHQEHSRPGAAGVRDGRGVPTVGAGSAAGLTDHS